MRECALLKVHGTLDTLERYAEEQRWEMQSRESDDKVPFTAEAKRAGRIAHSMCECGPQDLGNDCNCCRTVRIVQSSKGLRKRKIGVCKCDLFFPYERSELVRRMLLDCLDRWTPWALNHRSEALLQSAAPVSANMSLDPFKLAAAARGFRAGNGMVQAQRFDLVLDAFPLPTLHDDIEVAWTAKTPAAFDQRFRFPIGQGDSFYPSRCVWLLSFTSFSNIMIVNVPHSMCNTCFPDLQKRVCADAAVQCARGGHVRLAASDSLHARVFRRENRSVL